MIYAILLAGGTGRRTGLDVPKQYIEVNGKPLLYYSLKALENSPVEKITIVADEEHISFVLSEIVDKYHFQKVIRICGGGKERFDSVLHGLDDLSDVASPEDIVLIHDGARPYLTHDEIVAVIHDVIQNDAAIAAVPAKDTIKIADENGFVAGTTQRQLTWQIQTPQGFRYGEIYDAYRQASVLSEDFRKALTDDAMVLECIYPNHKIKLTHTAYSNVKVTTAEDLEVAKDLLQ